MKIEYYTVGGNGMRIAICDDNQIDINKERMQITEVMQEMNIDNEITEYTHPLDLINSDKEFDIIFLDVEMADANGLKVAQAIRGKNRRCLMFFVTNYENYMDAALDEYAFRFWVKPINKQRLKQGIESAIKRMEGFYRAIEVNINRIKTNIEIRKIIYICADSKKTRLVTTEGEYLLSEPFKVIKGAINSYFFYEPHSSYYVNLNYVNTYNHTTVMCISGNKEYEIYMSRRKYADFNKYFINWMGDQI